MKNQALFSLKDKSKKLKCRLLQFLFGALRVTYVLFATQVKIMVGEAGDKIIRLKGTGTSDLPELDVRKKMNPGDETSTIYRIIYKE